MSGSYTMIGNEGIQELAHRVVSERYLGRKLTPEEVVHHLDEDKGNNKIENIIVFKTNRYYLDYHKRKTRNMNYRPRVDKSMTVEMAKAYYNKVFGIILYGPFFKQNDIDQRNRLIEKTKRDLGIMT